MSWIVQNLWLIPALPLLAAGLSAVAKRHRRTFAATLAIGSMGLALGLSICAFAVAVHHSAHSATGRQVVNFDWFQIYEQHWVRLGWVLDPLTAVMLLMVSFVGLLIFIYSVGYMAHDENFTRFFCFLSLFAAAMLGVVIANSLLLLFICWELVGLTSYLLIGFWFQKPSAAAAAKKAFITTRLGDLAFLLGMVWLYSQAGTLLFYDRGQGCLEGAALARLVTTGTSIGLAVSTGIGLLIFCGAIGKSGQVPLHVWLPDAMEGPTPVSALIHAATMVAAGVFLIARVYPLLAGAITTHATLTTALQAVTWLGAITAVFAASIAVAQTDIKRILAYSTVSQLGFMMLGLGAGGVAVGMFHLITHAFFKALLFLGAGSVIHGCHEEQDIRRMGGLRQFMPVTFATYAIGMLALAGFPLVVSGFWSKDEILHAARNWPSSHGPFYLGALGALLTAFYMTRQVCYVFFGRRAPEPSLVPVAAEEAPAHPQEHGAAAKARPLSYVPHESPPVMTVPLMILAAFAIGLGFLGTPAWPWFQTFVGGEAEPARAGTLMVMAVSTAIVLIGLGMGWWLYGRSPEATRGEVDVLEHLWPNVFALLRRKYFVDEVYEWAVVGFNAWWARACAWMDDWIWDGLVRLLALVVTSLSWLDRFFDEYVVNLGFDAGCRSLSEGGRWLALLQNGRVQHYLRIIAAGLVVLTLLLIWGWPS